MTLNDNMSSWAPNYKQACLVKLKKNMVSLSVWDEAEGCVEVFCWASELEDQ